MRLNKLINRAHTYKDEELIIDHGRIKKSVRKGIFFVGFLINFNSVIKLKV